MKKLGKVKKKTKSKRVKQQFNLRRHFAEALFCFDNVVCLLDALAFACVRFIKY